MRLAVPTNDTENQNIFTAKAGTGSTDNNYWLGISDEQVEGTWVDLDGNQIQYNKFKSGEPNGKTGENCVLGEWIDGLWNDASCSKKKQYVCESSPNSGMFFPN